MITPIHLITLTHANLNEKMDLAAHLVAGFYHSPNHKCTHIVASGGAVFPASESVEEVRRLLTNVAMATAATTVAPATITQGQEAQKEQQ